MASFPRDAAAGTSRARRRQQPGDAPPVPPDLPDTPPRPRGAFPLGASFRDEFGDDEFGEARSDVDSCEAEDCVDSGGPETPALAPFADADAAGRCQACGACGAAIAPPPAPAAGYPAREWTGASGSGDASWSAGRLASRGGASADGPLCAQRAVLQTSVAARRRRRSGTLAPPTEDDDAHFAALEGAVRYDPRLAAPTGGGGGDGGGVWARVRALEAAEQVALASREESVAVARAAAVADFGMGGPLAIASRSGGLEERRRRERAVSAARPTPVRVMQGVGMKGSEAGGAGVAEKATSRRRVMTKPRAERTKILPDTPTTPPAQRSVSPVTTEEEKTESPKGLRAINPRYVEPAVLPANVTWPILTPQAASSGASRSGSIVRRTPLEPLLTSGQVKHATSLHAELDDKPSSMPPPRRKMARRLVSAEANSKVSRSQTAPDTFYEHTELEDLRVLSGHDVMEGEFWRRETERAAKPTSGKPDEDSARRTLSRGGGVLGRLLSFSTTREAPKMARQKSTPAAIPKSQQSTRQLPKRSVLDWLRGRQFDPAA